MLSEAKRTVDTLIVGSTSVIGGAIASELKALGQVRTAGRRNADIAFDLTQPDFRAAAGKTFDVAVFVAADFGGSTDEDFTRATEVNVVGALAACRLASAVGVAHFVLISSISATYVPGDSYFGIYSLTKRLAEDVVAFYCQQRNITLTILRPTAIYDAEGRCRAHQGLLYGIVDCARVGSDFIINGSADPQRNYLFVTDFARIVRRVIETARAGTYACTHLDSLSIAEIAKLAFAVFGTDGRVVFDGSKSDIPSIPPLPSTDPTGSTPRSEHRFRRCHRWISLVEP